MAMLWALQPVRRPDGLVSRAMDSVTPDPAHGPTAASTLVAESARRSPSAPEPEGPQRPSLWQAFRTLHRLEGGPMFLFVLLWGMAVGASRLSDLWSVPAILAFLINGLSLFSRFTLNAYYDYPIDRRSQVKGYVADAVERVGRSRTLALYWIEQAITVAAAAAVSLLLYSWVFVVVKLVGILAGLVYNQEPIRMKRRGIWNPISLAIGLGFVPGMIAYFAVHDAVIGPGGWLALLGASVLSFSRGCWNSVSDTDEDRAEGITTPAVRYGPRAAMRIAIISLVPACLMIAVGLWLLFGPVYALVGVAGAAGATVFRWLLLNRTTDDDSAVALMGGPIRRLDARWSQATYITITLAGLAHVIVTSGLR